MRAEKVVAYLLSNDAGVTTICGQKIWGGMAKQGAEPPLVVFAKGSGAIRRPYLDFTSQVVEAPIDVMCIGRTYQELKELAEAVRVALTNQQGTIAGVTVVDTQYADEGPDEPIPELDQYAQVWSFTVVHVEP